MWLTEESEHASARLHLYTAAPGEIWMDGCLGAAAVACSLLFLSALSPPRDLFRRMHPSPLIPHPSMSLRCAPMMRRRHAGAAVSLLASVAVVALFVLRRLFVSLPETLSCRPLGLR